MDDAFQPGAAGSTADYGVGGSKTAGGWGSLGGFEATRKENERKHAKFRGATPWQCRSHSQPCQVHSTCRAFTLLHLRWAMHHGTIPAFRVTDS